MTFDEFYPLLCKDNGIKIDGDYSGEIHDYCLLSFNAGAESRNDEISSLTNQRDYEFVRAENATMERDQLRTCLSRILNAIKVVEFDSEEVLDFDECTAMCVPMDAYYGLIEAAETFAATESK